MSALVIHLELYDHTCISSFTSEIVVLGFEVVMDNMLALCYSLSKWQITISWYCSAQTHGNMFSLVLQNRETFPLCCGLRK